VKKDIGETVRVGGTSFGSLLRALGRAALWTVLGLLFLRGTADALRPPAAVPPARGSSFQAQQASDAFAVRFARTYLAEPSPEALLPFLAAGAKVGQGRPPSAGAGVAQAEVVASRPLGGGRAVVTVACELRDARTLFLAVPIVRSRADEVAALGAPSIVAAPAVAGVEASRPQPLAGSEAGVIEALVGKFLPAYLSSSEASELTYLLAPGAAVAPLAGELEPLDERVAGQLGSGEGSRRTVIASARVSDPASGAVYPLAYRLQLVKRGRWYVSGVEGALP
jgi:hypothetical protein